MGLSTNSILIIVSIVLAIIILILMYVNARGKQEIVFEEDYKTVEEVLEGVKIEMVELIKEDFTLGCSDDEFDKLYKRKARVQDALKKCVYGIDSAKALVIDLIRGFIDDNVADEHVSSILGLDAESEPSDHIMFEIIMYRYKKRYGKGALDRWMKKNNFARERRADDSVNKRDKSFYITVADLQQSYMDENIVLDINEKRDVLAIITYQLYKGFGIIDTLREMDIDGINLGTSGSILSAMNNTKNTLNRANNSVWLYYSGTYIHLKFMNFGNEDELKRLIQLLIRYNSPGSLTAKKGYIVNTMYDKSRILALRPPASEYWAVFIRKFTLKDSSPEALIIKPYTKNGATIISLLEYLMRGQVTCAVTGRQGSGKTTLMSSIVRYIDPRYTIRVLEMAPELYLRELYPTRNILSLQETQHVSAAALQDALKKSDAAVSMVGEVATDSIAARMIQMGMTASLFTIFSHHANTTKDLILTLRNSLAADGGFDQMTIAEKQVTDVVRVDVHLDYKATGERYIARVSEIVQLEFNCPYPDYDSDNKEDSMNNITKEYYHRVTDRVSFKVRDIIKYDTETDSYVTLDRLSSITEDRMIANLGVEMGDEFRQFTIKNWGIRKEEDDYEENMLLRGETVESLLSQNDVDDDEVIDLSALKSKIAKVETVEVESSDISDEFSIGLFDDFE